MFAILALLGACGAPGGGDPGNGAAGDGPVIDAFDVDPEDIVQGGTGRLTWTVSDADTLVVNPGDHDVTGASHLDVRPMNDTTYTLRASNEDGVAEADATLRVTEADPATTLSAHLTEVSFPGTSELTIDVSADGAWTAESEQSWIEVTPDVSAGDRTVTVRVDRTGLDPAFYAGSILFRGAEPLEVVTVAMRFPTLSGTVSDVDGGIDTLASDSAASDSERARTARVPEGAGVVPGEVLVAFDAPLVVATARGEGRHDPADGLRFAEVASLGVDVAGRHGLTFDRVIGAPDGIALLRGADSVAAAIERLEDDPRVRYAEPNPILESYFTPNDPLYPDQWHYDSISMQDAWSVTMGDPNVVVAVIDGGFLLSHEDLVGQWVDGFDFTPEGTSPNANTYECARHGTHVAGTVGAATHNGVGVAGVAPGVGLMPLKIGMFDSNENDCVLAGAALLEALYHVGGATTNAPAPPEVLPSVVNLSLGGGYSRVLDEAIAYVTNMGITVVAAAGNDPTAPVAFPAAFGNTVAVSALDPNDDLASYSTFGEEITLAAPGGDVDRFGDVKAGVLSTVPTGALGDDYAWFQGTSMAAPHVAGVVGLLASVNRDLTPTQVRDILTDTATDLGLVGRDTFFGYGKVHAADAVQMASGLLTADADDVFVHLWDGASLERSGRAAPDGTFDLGQVAAGTYTLEAGTDPDGSGILGSGGSFFVQRSIVVDESGDASVDLMLERR